MVLTSSSPSLLASCGATETTVGGEGLNNTVVVVLANCSPEPLATHFITLFSPPSMSDPANAHVSFQVTIVPIAVSRPFGASLPDTIEGTVSINHVKGETAPVSQFTTFPGFKVQGTSYLVEVSVEGGDGVVYFNLNTPAGPSPCSGSISSMEVSPSLPLLRQITVCESIFVDLEAMEDFVLWVGFDASHAADDVTFTYRISAVPPQEVPFSPSKFTSPISGPAGVTRQLFVDIPRDAYEGRSVSLVFKGSQGDSDIDLQLKVPAGGCFDSISNFVLTPGSLSFASLPSFRSLPFSFPPHSPLSILTLSTHDDSSLPLLQLLRPSLHLLHSLGRRSRFAAEDLIC